MRTNYWTPQEVETLLELRAQGMRPFQIAKIMKTRSARSIQDKLELMARPQRRLPGGKDPSVVRLDEELLRDRDRRILQPPRNLTAAIMGDPPVGYSALERRPT